MRPAWGRSEKASSALERFIEVIQTDRYYDDDGARKACVALFTLPGNEHPAVAPPEIRYGAVLGRRRAQGDRDRPSTPAIYAVCPPQELPAPAVQP